MRSYHLAEKKIPSIHGYTLGLKLEQFVFDAFAYAPSTALFEVSSIYEQCLNLAFGQTEYHNLFLFLIYAESMLSDFTRRGVCTCEECQW